MNGWTNKALGEDYDNSSFSLPSRSYNNYNSKGLENGVVNILQQEQELLALQKALNLPQMKTYSTSLTQLSRTPLLDSSVLASSQTKVVTKSDPNTNTESLYMYSLSDPNKQHGSYARDLHPLATPFSYSASSKHNTMHNPGNIRTNENVDSSVFPGTEYLFHETSKLYRSHLSEPAPVRNREDFQQTGKNPLEESREYFLGRMMEAHKIIQYQNEAIARSEKEISNLQKQLQNLEMDQEVNISEIKNLRFERQNMDKIKSEGAKKREALLIRINQLDQDFRELSLSHNALLVECKKREGDFLQSNLQLNALEAYNNNLQQANTRMQKECDMAKQQVDKIMGENKQLQTESQEAKGMAASAMQDKQRLDNEITVVNSTSSETAQQLLQEKTSKEKLKQEYQKLQMEYSIKCNRIALLEEEVKQQQETFAVLQNELEQSFQREAKRRSMENSLMNLSLRQRTQGTQLMDGSSNVDTPSNEIDNLKNQLAEKNEECRNLHEALDDAKRENAKILTRNRSTKEKLDYMKQIKAQIEKDLQHLTNDNEDLYAQITQLKQYEQQSHQVRYLQEELEKIKMKLTGLEKDKGILMTDLQKFQEDKNVWEKEKGEMIMSLAEVEAENSELRQLMKDDTVKLSADSVTEEVQTIQQELDKVHKLLRLKDEELETQKTKIQEKQTELNKLTKEANDLRKSYAELSSKTSSRNLVISSLGDQIEKHNETIAQLQKKLSGKSQQYDDLSSCHIRLEADLSQSSSEALQWITSDRKRLEEQRDMLMAQVLELQSRPGREDPLELQDNDGRVPPDSLNSQEELTSLSQENARLHSRLESLIKERDSVLHDSEDLMEGMQQLKEAFEDEIERRLEKEREKSVTQQESVAKEHKQCITEKNSLQEKCDVLLKANKNLDLQCKNMEFERDELRRQVNELCESRARSEEKATQTDAIQSSPRQKAARGRKRSKSVGVIVPIVSLDGDEESNSSPDCSPTSSSPRQHKSR